MKRLLFKLLILAGCISLTLGCSSVNPQQKQPVATVAPSVQKRPCVAHNSLMKQFVRGWLEGNAPPPDFKEEDKTGIAACLGAAYWASIAGLLIAGGGH